MAAAATTARLVLCLMAHRMLISGTLASVFITDQLLPTFSTLDSRQCLPDDFSPGGSGSASACAARVQEGGLPPECQGAPLLAQFYNCHAANHGLITAESTELGFEPEIQSFISQSNNQEWKQTIVQLFDDCQDKTFGGLTIRQEAVYSYLCLKWSVFSNCDQKQEEAGSLDEAGALRRVRFLAGECPLSPRSLPRLEEASGYTFEECSQPSDPEDDPPHLYSAEVSRIVCLLQDFTDAAGNINIHSLREVFFRQLSEFAEAMQLLNDILIPCSEMNEPNPVAVEEFVRCWAGKGIFSCVFQQANQEASQFPNDCVISI